MQKIYRSGSLLGGFALVSLFSLGTAFAGGTPSDAAGAQGHNAPSIAAPTTGISEGDPNAKILPYSALDENDATKEAEAARQSPAK
ncbi:hypothetical protein [Beijerinckia mobilis]|uniref:hypothetical protein n=1 Tax=Beijerinckia mobilis TaxID=231434 RepID=UPI00054E89DD|nr:hypothetical protein [Beijerinckia mobilis]